MTEKIYVGMMLYLFIVDWNYANLKKLLRVVLLKCNSFVKIWIVVVVVIQFGSWMTLTLIVNGIGWWRP